MSEWTTEAISNQSGKTFVITGANSGIGYEAAKVLARKGAKVILACRSAERAHVAIDTIKQTTPSAEISFTQLDLADLSSVRSCAQDLCSTLAKIDVLINNAGVMALPRMLTKDGFEMQIGTNHFGHFALTAGLFPKLKLSDHSRIITVASSAHKGGRMNFKDIHGKTSYTKWGAYAQSKLANLLFFHELHRRLQDNNSSTLSVACHPGYADTNLQFVGVNIDKSPLSKAILTIGNRYVAQSAEAGAWPTLFAATEVIKSGSYVGPSRLFEMKGPPKLVRSTRKAQNEQSARQLWQLSEELTGLRLP